VDRLIITNLIRARLTDSVELALRQGGGMMIVMHQDPSGQWRETLYSEKHACPDCGISFEPPTPRHFSFNSPYGACPSCSGLGLCLLFDEDLVAPNRELSIAKGAIHAWRRGGRRLIIYYNGLLRALAKHYDFSLGTPFRELPASVQKFCLMVRAMKRLPSVIGRRGAWRQTD